MEAHYWLFPWLSLFTSLSAAIGALFLCRRDPSQQTPPPLSISPIGIWIAAIALMIAGGLKIGDWAAVDYIPARGVLAGAIGGMCLALHIRRRTAAPEAPTAVMFGLSTALVTASRLWLTHGELSGLIASALSAGTTMLCLTVGPSLCESNSPALIRCGLALAYVAALVGATLLGFSTSAAWGDLPLMYGAALSVGLLIAASVDRFGTVQKAFAVIAVAAAVLVPLGLSVAHSISVVADVAAGALAVAVPLGLLYRAKARELALCLGFLLLIAGTTEAFSLLAGYGLALFALGVLTVAAIVCSVGGTFPASWTAFGALLTIYRLELLQNVSSTRSIGPGNVWDLFAIALGVLLPKSIGAWIGESSTTSRGNITLQWLAAIAAPGLVLDYIWQPRTLTGLFLGLAVGQLSGAGEAGARRDSILAFTSLLLSLLLFVFLPSLDVLTAPTRSVRIVCVVLLSFLVAARIAFQRSAPQAPAEAV